MPLPSLWEKNLFLIPTLTRPDTASGHSLRSQRAGSVLAPPLPLLTATRFPLLQAEGSKRPRRLQARLRPQALPHPRSPSGRSPMALTPPCQQCPPRSPLLPRPTEPPAACPRPSPAHRAAGRCPRPARTRPERAPAGLGARSAGWAAPSRPASGGRGGTKGGTGRDPLSVARWLSDVPGAEFQGVRCGLMSLSGMEHPRCGGAQSPRAGREGAAAAAPGIGVGFTKCVSITKTTTGSQHTPG